MVLHLPVLRLMKPNQVDEVAVDVVVAAIDEADEVALIVAAVVVAALIVAEGDNYVDAKTQ